MILSTPAPSRPCSKPDGSDWKMALCSESTGSIRAPLRRASAMNTSPAMTSDSLLASRIFLPRWAARNADSRPAAPTIAAITISVSSRPAACANPAGPDRTSLRAPRAASAVFSSVFERGVGNHGQAGIETRALVGQFPDVAIGGQGHDPEAAGIARDDVQRAVADRSGRSEDAIRLAGSLHQQAVSQGEKGCAGQQAVVAVENTAVAGEQRAGVIQPDRAFVDADEQVAADRRHRGQQRS